MENIFRLLHYLDEEKVMFTTHMLEEEFDNWLKGESTHLQDMGVLLTWETFRSAFLEKYIPKPIRKQKN